ncbi:MAG TPA: hypothetical protein VIX60_07450 [Candidatus Cybelea sp.]
MMSPANLGATDKESFQVIFHSSRWAVPATLAAAFALSACAGGSLSTSPAVRGFNETAPAGADSAALSRIAIVNTQPNVTCPKKYDACLTVSKKNGLAMGWCYGPGTKPCAHSNAGKAKWSGVVCKVKDKTCKKPVKELTAKWSGPFKCKRSDKCKGTYELDTFTPGPGLKVTKKYIYKQDIHACVGAKCEILPIGINIGK